MTKCAMILCAGNASRAGLGFNKVFYSLGQKCVLETVLEKFVSFDKIVVVAACNDIPQIKEILQQYDFCYNLIEGGKTRSDSVKNGLKAAEGCDIVTIHDAARPFVSTDLINRTVISAQKHGSGVAAIKVIDSIKETDSSGSERIIISKTFDRTKLYAAQTPQSFKYTEIKDAYDKIQGVFEDDSEVYRLAGYTSVIVEGEYKNKKLTSPSDFFPVNGQLIGTGFDVHQLVAGRKLVIGGVEIPFNKGLLGHSDADVLLHAVMDALLSAAGLPDIGVLFPDTDSAFKDADSMALLKEVAVRMKVKGIKTEYVSAVIIAQSPKMAGHINNMKKNVAAVLESYADCINISATTTEFMGIVGNGEAIAASAVCICALS